MSSPLLRRRAIAVLAPLVLVLAACGDDDDDGDDAAAADTASVSFVAPSDGDRLAGGVHLEMAAEGLTIEEAGVVHEGAGHFHVIADDGCVDPGAAVPRDADHVHFGKGQSEGTIYLEPGEHELCLQPGDGDHVALDPTDTVTIDVGITDREEWCAVIGEADELFEATDTGGDDFAVRQVGYVNITRLIAQLTDGLDQVDADARDAVGQTIADGARIANTFVEASDAEDAQTRLEAVFGPEGIQSDGVGSTWILDNCGVDIDGEG